MVATWWPLLQEVHWFDTQDVHSPQSKNMQVLV